MFEIGDKVETTKEHDHRFGSHEEGIIEKVDDNYIELRTRMGKYISLSNEWVQNYKGDFNWLYKGKLI